MELSAVTTDSQHMRALAQANRVRLARARLKRRVASGEIEAAEVVMNCPWEAESMKICELLTSQRRWGKERCRKFLLPTGLSENKRVADLTERQKVLLSTLLVAKTNPEIMPPPPDRFRDRRLVAA